MGIHEQRVHEWGGRMWTWSSVLQLHVLPLLQAAQHGINLGTLPLLLLQWVMEVPALGHQPLGYTLGLSLHQQLKEKRMD